MSKTIQILDTVKETLERMIEDNLEINERTKKEIEEVRKRIKAGKFLT